MVDLGQKKVDLNDPPFFILNILAKKDRSNGGLFNILNNN